MIELNFPRWDRWATCPQRAVYSDAGPQPVRSLTFRPNDSPKGISDYPKFYTRLYAFLDEDLLHHKHRARFFRLTDLFLSST